MSVDLAAWRKANNYSQAATAKHLGISVRTLIRWEKPNATQPTDLADRLVSARPEPVAAPSTLNITIKTHPDLYGPRRRGEIRQHALHPERLFARADPFLDQHRERPGDVCSPILATILETPEYRAVVLRHHQAVAALPQRITDDPEAFDAAAASGLTFDQLYKS